ncbi:cofilin [Entomortierella chlamydospora]|uniref:Cofilin n=1 Tax=Entomortierella chlamydospora TaxID=101097 RepID=A0A9P6MYS8_9FUNG|nr:cofilin [Entomortierella chlamydospora]
MNSASGVQADPDCVASFQELKLGKKVKFIIFKLSDDNKSIIVERKAETATYDEFLKHLPKNDCRWAVYDFDYKTPEGDRNKIVFYTWLPDAAPIKSKEWYTVNKDALFRSLDGIGAEIQDTNYDGVSYSTVLKSVARG